MTDISGNFSINHHYENNEIQPKKECAGECCSQDKACENKTQVDLDKQPAAVSGRALVKKADKTGEYKFDPKKVEDDVQEYMLLAQTAKDTYQSFKEAGLSDEEAQNKTVDFVEALYLGLEEESLPA